jgi:hypothetical protein
LASEASKQLLESETTGAVKQIAQDSTISNERVPAKRKADESSVFESFQRLFDNA